MLPEFVFESSFRFWQFLTISCPFLHNKGNNTEYRRHSSIRRRFRSENICEVDFSVKIREIDNVHTCLRWWA